MFGWEKLSADDKFAYMMFAVLIVLIPLVFYSMWLHGWELFPSELIGNSPLA